MSQNHVGHMDYQNQVISLQSGVCPITGRMSYALYEGEMPIIPATIYLRHLAENDGLAHNTILTYAYALKPFFQFLQVESVSFWNLTPGVIKKYKHYLIQRTAMADTKMAIRHQTVQLYINAVKGLIQYWRGLHDADRFFYDRGAEIDGIRLHRHGRGHLHTSWDTRVPNSTWTVRIPTSARHTNYHYKGLSRDQLKRVMEVLNNRKHRTPVETLLYYRDRAIWTFSLMSCVRKGELVRIRLEDANRNLGIIMLKDRPEDRWLGELKSGPGEIYVTSDNPFWSYLESWLLYGRPIAEEILKARGQNDHNLLFCNCDGGPLTQAAVNNLFDKLKRECKLGPNAPIHQHVARHTMATFLLESGVELEAVQKYLRHISIQSTQVYAVVTTRSLRKAMETFWSTYKI